MAQAPLALAACLLLCGSLAPALPEAPDAQAATAAPAWPALSAATIRPGNQVSTSVGQCTSNFVFYEDLGGGLFDIYLGMAAHCASLGTPTQTNGCTTPSLPLNANVAIQGATKPGKLAYSSWLAMQANLPQPSSVCQYNDFALVKVDPADHNRIHPSVRHFGGPVGLAPAGAATLGDKTISFQNSGLRFGNEPLAWKEGYHLFYEGGTWSSKEYFATFGVPGDSGSGVMLMDGRAFGVLVTVAVTPYPMSNGVTVLDHALGFANGHGMNVSLATAPLLDDGLLPSL